MFGRRERDLRKEIVTRNEIKCYVGNDQNSLNVKYTQFELNESRYREGKFVSNI